MADTGRSDKQLKRTAALLASRPGVVDHVRRTGQLPAEIPSGGMHIGARMNSSSTTLQKQRWQPRTPKDRGPFRRLSKKGRGRAQRSLDLIDAMFDAAEAAQPITGRNFDVRALPESHTKSFRYVPTERAPIPPPS